MNERKLAGIMRMLFDQCADADDEAVEDGWPEELRNCSTRSFEEEQLLTDDPGIVLELEDGTKFYLTIQEARR